MLIKKFLRRQDLEPTYNMYISQSEKKRVNIQRNITAVTFAGIALELQVNQRSEQILVSLFQEHSHAIVINIPRGDLYYINRSREADCCGRHSHLIIIAYNSTVTDRYGTYTISKMSKHSKTK